MGHLHVRRQVLQSTKEKPPESEMEDKIKKKFHIAQLCNLAQPKIARSTQIYAEVSPPLQAGVKNTYM